MSIRRFVVLAALAACGAPSAQGSDPAAGAAPPAGRAARPAAPAAGAQASVAPAAGGAEGRVAHGLLRYPDVSATQVAFVYGDDLWVVPREGGVALPLSSPPGPESFPRFSPDGSRVLYSANYDGGRDLFVVPVAGGVPLRLTHHPATEQGGDWTPDGRVLFSSPHESGLGGRAQQLFTVSAQGGLPERLPVPYGGNASISADGEWLAYVPVPFDFRTWKRYRGGTAMDVWLFNLGTRQSRRMTDWEGSDTYPMWQGPVVYYLSDAGASHLLQVWSFDTRTGAREQVTDLPQFDVRFPAIGPGPDGQGEIVFQHGADLCLLDLPTRKVRTLAITIPGDKPTLAPRRIEVAQAAAAFSVSPTGQRVAIEARGDIWTAPKEHGAPRNLTASDDATDRDPSWSPDGKLVAYSSDRDGEYELWLAPADGKGAPRQLTDGHAAYFRGLAWSPDGKHLAFGDQSGRLYVADAEGGAVVEIDRDERGGPLSGNWSPDSRWLTWSKSTAGSRSAVWLWNREGGAPVRVTSGYFADTWPCFDRKGDFLYYASNRDFSQPTYETTGTTFVYAETDRLVGVPLRADVKSPWLPKSDEEPAAGKDGGKDGSDAAAAGSGADAGAEASAEAADAKDAKDGSGGKDAKDGKDAAKPPAPVAIDLDGFERRALLLPVPRGTFAALAVDADGALVYLRAGAPDPDGEAPPSGSVHRFDPADEKHEEQQLAAKADGFELSADGKVLLVVSQGKATLQDPKPGAEAKPVVTDGMAVLADPRAEWREMLVDAWRRYRDWFYDPQMHGVDWPAMRDRYLPMIDDCVTRADVGWVIRELISELNVGHAYYFPGGDEGEQVQPVPVGLLGCDFDLDRGAYRIARLLRGADWDLDARGPLQQPGAEVAAGEYLLAVNGVPPDTAVDPWAPFVGLAGQPVLLTVGPQPTRDGSERDVLVTPVASDGELRYRDWVEANRRHVEAAGGGRVGYVHVPDTGVRGQDELFRQFQGQREKEALIVDERWNGGGQIPTRFIELLNRPATNLWASRDALPQVWPPDGHQGPKCMLINQRAGSGGDCFPYYFRQAKLGPLVGVRTWGGLVGISGEPPLLDGAAVSVPSFAFYELDGTWGVEGHGVDPDVEVLDDPAAMQDGADPQLDTALGLMLDALAAGKGFHAPPPPAGPDRSGMGVLPADR